MVDRIRDHVHGSRFVSMRELEAHLEGLSLEPLVLPVVIDLGRRRLELERRAVELTYLEFELLSLLVRSPTIVPHADILNAIWPGGKGTRRRLTVLASRLRAKLGVHADLLVTHRHIGYRFVMRPEVALIRAAEKPRSSGGRERLPRMSGEWRHGADAPSVEV